ncbi:MAG: WD40 repeat domain-containing protein [Pseudomonadota bacterium]
MTVPSLADRAPDRLDFLQSEWYARASQEALLTGDRSTAILTALRGFPSDPTEEEFEYYGAAHRALFRAVASQSARLDVDLRDHVIISPNGTRAISIDGASLGVVYREDLVAPVETELPVLHDMQSGERLREIEIGLGVGLHLVDSESTFSVDGRWFSFVDSRSGEVRVFSAMTGDLIWRFTELAEAIVSTTAGGNGLLGGVDFLEFSPNGMRIAAGGRTNGRTMVWNLDTGQVEIDVPVAIGGDWRHMRAPAFWGPDNQLYFHSARLDGSGKIDGPHTLERLQSGSLIPVYTIPPATEQRQSPNTSFSPFGSAPYVYQFVYDESYSVRILDLAENRAIEIPELSEFAAAFSHGRTMFPLYEDRITFNQDDSADFTFFSYDALGNEVETRLRDEVGLLTRVYNLEGRLVLSTSIADHPAMPIPSEGRDLYDFVWSNIPTEVQDVIERERIARP